MLPPLGTTVAASVRASPMVTVGNGTVDDIDDVAWIVLLEAVRLRDSVQETPITDELEYVRRLP